MPRDHNPGGSHACDSKFSLTLAATAILLLLAIALTSLGANSRFTQSSAPKPSTKAAVAQTMKTYTMYSGLWRTDGGFVSTIRVKNVLVVAPMDITPVLFMADGTVYPLPSVHLAVSGVATININDALANAPQSIASHVSQFGSAALIHTYSSPGHVSASMAVIDVPRSLSYTFPFSEPMGDPMQQTLEGLWWKHDPNVSGWIALSNVSDSATQATLQLVGHRHEAQAERTIALPAHTTQMFHLEDFADNPSPLMKDAGGIRVEYNGQPRSVLVTGGLENDSEGYSANIPFWGHDMSSAPASSITYASAGLMIGKPDPMMMPGFPSTTIFTPYLVLRNTTEKPLDVSLQLNYMIGMGGTSTGMNSSAPITRNLPTQHLAPLAARQVDMQPILNSAGLSKFNGSTNLTTSFTGKGGDLVLASGSVDQTGTYVFEVEPQGVSSSLSKFTNYWGVANRNDTMFTLWNPTDTAQDILATFYYGDGSGKYALPVRLEAQASTMIDMAMLIMEKKPDADGNVIPANIQEGSAQFSSAKGGHEPITLVIAGGIYNVSTATCGSSCITCCGDSNFGINPNPIICPIGESMSCSPTTVDCNGYLVWPSSWSSSNTAVMTVNSSGVVTGVAVGTANITAIYSFAPVYTGQICGGQNCPTGSPAPQAPANVIQVQVTNVDLTSDQVKVNLQGPSGSSGTLVVTWNGPGPNQAIANANEGVGTYTFNPPLGGLVTGQYTGVTAQWLGASNTYSTSFDVLGSYLHTQYNSPAESQCSGTSGPAYLTPGPSACVWNNVSLVQQFITQAWINGSGYADGSGHPNYGPCQEYLAGCSPPPNGNQNYFRQVSTITPGCGGANNFLSNTSVAVDVSSPNHPLRCGDQVLVVGLGSGVGTVKTATDSCPACNGAAQIDDYNTSNACSLTSLGNFPTIRINR